MKKLKVLFCLIAIILCCGCDRNSLSDEMTFMTWGSESEINIIKEVIGDYEKLYPERKKVKLIHTPQNYFQKLHLYFASDIAPDVVFLNNIYSKIYMNSGLLEDLTPYFEEELKNNTFYKSATDSFSQSGKLFAVPRDISDLVIYINKDIFKKNNTIVPKEFVSLDDFYSTAARLKTENNFSVNVEPMSIYWLNFLLLNGGGLLSDDLSKVIITTPKSIEAFQKYVDLSYKYHFAPTKTEIASKTTAQMFINGELAMYISGRWMVPKFRSTIKDFDWDVVRFPVSPEHKLAIDTSGWAISKSSTNKEDGINFIKYMSSREVIEKITKQGLIVPARIDVATSDVFLDSQKPLNSKAFIDILSCSKPTPVNVNYSFINDILQENLEEVFSGKKSAKEVLDGKFKMKLETLL